MHRISANHSIFTPRCFIAPSGHRTINPSVRMSLARARRARRAILWPERGVAAEGVPSLTSMQQVAMKELSFTPIACLEGSTSRTTILIYRIPDRLRTTLSSVLISPTRLRPAEQGMRTTSSGISSISIRNRSDNWTRERGRPSREAATRCWYLENFFVKKFETSARVCNLL